MPTKSPIAPSPTLRLRKTRLVDVAKEAGVSISVVGTVLNGGGGNTRVAPQTADRILEIAERLNYRASPTAQQLRGKRSNVFGLLVASAGDPLTSFLVEHLDEEVVKHGCQTLIGNTAIAPGRFEASVDEFVARGVDGIFCIVHNMFPGDRATLLARCPNTVFYCDPGVANATFIDIDQGLAGKLAAEHLLERGHSRIGFAINDPKIPSIKGRIQGIKAAIKGHRLKSDALSIFDGEPGSAGPSRPDERTMEWKSSDSLLDAIIDQVVVNDRCTAIIAHNDFLASGLIKRLRCRGISVPGDVAVIGYLNHYLCDYIDPPLSSVDLNHHLAAKAMVSVIQEMIEAHGSEVRKRHEVLIPPRLISRQSG